LDLRLFSASFLLLMRRNSYLWTSGLNLDTAVRFPDPDFLLECKYLAIWRRLPLFFLHFICWMSAIFLLPVCLTYWARKYTTRVNPTSIIPTKFEVDMSTLPSYSVFVCWYVTWPCDLELWPFDLEQLSYMAGHMANSATKSEDPRTIRSRVTRYNGSHWLPLKMPTRPLRMLRITWFVSRGSKAITLFEYPTPSCLFTMQLR